jgi:hypothetical protein
MNDRSMTAGTYELFVWLVAAAFHAEPDQIRQIGVAAGIHVH